MSKSDLVHWQEGLFLQPHHLQLMQSSLISAIGNERQLANPYPYGVVSSKVSLDALESKIVKFDNLKVVMPSGYVVDTEINCTLPSLDIKKKFNNSKKAFTVFLALPFWQPDQANTLEDMNGETRIKRVFTVKEIEKNDENTGINPIPVRVKTLNARLVLEEDDNREMELVPVLRVARSTDEEEAIPKVDKYFIPPAFHVNGANNLADMLNDLLNQMVACRNQLIDHFNKRNFQLDSLTGNAFEQVIRLKTIAAYTAELDVLLNSQASSAFSVYVSLRKALAELGCLKPSDEIYNTSAYDHDNLFPVFNELIMHIREFLKDNLKVPYKKGDFTINEEMLMLDLVDEIIEGQRVYFLGITSPDDPAVLSDMVENGDQFKLMPYKDRKKAIYGVKLKSEKFPPIDLPSKVGLSYFKLQLSDSSSHLWDEIKQEKSIQVKPFVLLLIIYNCL